ncbi:MAG: T9SS type A sorting domain-containing protein [Bacteroidales bacterium]|jgi:hypothetical protein|nr:T9SS type A sorting domain-containing protein [Bacteroidales bacterium]
MSKKHVLCILIAVFTVGSSQAQNLIPGLTGSGSEDDPVLLATADDLRILSAFVMNDADYSTATANKHFKLTNDISFGEPCYDFDGDGIMESNFIPVGGRSDTSVYSNYRLFQGYFHGEGHVISGVRIIYNGVPYVGIFGVTWGATIEKVGVLSGSFWGYGCVGGLCGQANSGTVIRDSYVSNSVIVSDYWMAGGFVGATYSNSIVNNCYVTTTSVSGTDWVGGFCGNNNGSSAINNSYSVAIVMTVYNNFNLYGGFCGSNPEGSVIDNCYYQDMWQYSTDVEPNPSAEYGTPLTGSEMQSVWFMEQLNASQIPAPWALSPNQNYGYPILSWQISNEVSVNDIHRDGVSVYPNPTADKLFINTASANPLTVTLYDLYGRILMSYEGINTLDISALAKGVYMLSVRESGNTILNRTIIKQ